MLLCRIVKNQYGSSLVKWDAMAYARIMPTLIYWIALLGIIFSYMTLWYGVALYAKRYDVVDVAWGLGFVLLAWVSLALRGSYSHAQLVSAVLVTIWGVRLAGHIGARILKRPTEDYRYQAMRTKWGTRADQTAYRAIFITQGLLIVLVGLPAVAISFSRSTTNIVTYLGWTVWVAGIVIEAVADWQLRQFIVSRAAKSHKPCTIGLWHYSRHPNYFGEIVTWWGAGAVAVSLGAWWGIIGAITITILITRVSGIPPLEKKQVKNKEYDAYRAHTSILIPLPLKKS